METKQGEEMEKSLAHGRKPCVVIKQGTGNPLDHGVGEGHFDLTFCAPILCGLLLWDNHRGPCSCHSSALDLSLPTLGLMSTQHCPPLV